MSRITVRAESVYSDEARQLIAELSRELAELYDDPEEGEGAFTAADMDVAGAAFFVARVGGVAAGCGALRPFEEKGAAEVKRMFVLPRFRGRGLSRKLLQSIETAAREFGYTKLVLETGTLQPISMALYEKMGFTRRACWGKYECNPWSVCYEKVLELQP